MLETLQFPYALLTPGAQHLLVHDAEANRKLPEQRFFGQVQHITILVADRLRFAALFRKEAFLFRQGLKISDVLIQIAFAAKKGLHEHGIADQTPVRILPKPAKQLFSSRCGNR